MEKGKQVRVRGNTRLVNRAIASETTCFRHLAARPRFPARNTARIKFAKRGALLRMFSPFRTPRTGYLRPNPTKSGYKINKNSDRIPSGLPCLASIRVHPRSSVVNHLFKYKKLPNEPILPFAGLLMNQTLRKISNPQRKENEPIFGPVPVISRRLLRPNHRNSLDGDSCLFVPIRSTSQCVRLPFPRFNRAALCDEPVMKTHSPENSEVPHFRKIWLVKPPFLHDCMGLFREEY